MWTYDYMEKAASSLGNRAEWKRRSRQSLEAAQQHGDPRFVEQVERILVQVLAEQGYVHDAKHRLTEAGSRGLQTANLPNAQRKSTQQRVQLSGGNYPGAIAGSDPDWPDDAWNRANDWTTRAKPSSATVTFPARPEPSPLPWTSADGTRSERTRHWHA